MYDNSDVWRNCGIIYIITVLFQIFKQLRYIIKRWNLSVILLELSMNGTEINGEKEYSPTATEPSREDAPTGGLQSHGVW